MAKTIQGMLPWLFMPKPPEIDAVALRELELFGVEAVKVQFNYRGAGSPIPVRNAIVKPEDVFKWLKWKEDVATWWGRVSMVVGIVTLFVAILAAMFAFLSIPR
jgi:hypothetical protein